MGCVVGCDSGVAFNLCSLQASESKMTPYFIMSPAHFRPAFFKGVVLVVASAIVETDTVEVDTVEVDTASS